jgi:hypothetical protein
LSKLEYFYEARKPSVSLSLNIPFSTLPLPVSANQWKQNSAPNISTYPRTSSFLTVER